MKIIGWNIRGLNDLNKCDKMRAFFKDYSIDIHSYMNLKLNVQIIIFIEDWVVFILGNGFVYLQWVPRGFTDGLAR